MKRIPEHETTAIETLIDRYGLPALMNAVSEIAAEKADHVRENWQDEPLAKRWDKVSRFFDAAIGTAESFGIPE